MKKSLLGLAIVALSLGLVTTTVFADEDDHIPANAVSLATVVKNLQAAGYKTIHEVKFDDGIYKAEVISMQGKEIKLHIDPETGKVPLLTNSAPSISMLDAIQNAQKAGCAQIHEAEFEHEHYKVECHNANGEKLKMDINPQTGVVMHTKRDD